MKQVEDLADDQLSFTVSIVPRASRNEVVGWTRDGRLKVRVAAPPVDEGANRQLVRFLSKLLEVSKSDMSIVSGAHSRSKRLIVPESCKNRLLSFEDI